MRSFAPEARGSGRAGRQAEVAVPARRGTAPSPRRHEPRAGEMQRPTPRAGHDFSQVAVQAEDAGEPLAATDRRRLEALLDTRLGDVRVHRGPAAERAASALGAPAFTVGQHIVLGATARPDQARLLAHEAAHTVQQSGASNPPAASSVDLPRTAPGGAEERQADAAALGLERPTRGASLAIAAAPATAPLFTPAKRFKELWPAFQQASHGFDPARTTALAKELATAPYDFDDLLTHGAEVIDWLQHHGEPALAAQLLSDVRDVWMIRFVSRDAALPGKAALGWGSAPPDGLIALGKEAARAGKHAEAFRYFGVANEMLSYYAMEVSDQRMKTLDTESADDAREAQAAGNDRERQAIREALTFPRLIARSMQYSDLKSLYDKMREIYGFYSVLEREALAAGDAAAAAAARAKSSELHQEIKDKYTWGGTQAPGGIAQDVSAPVEIAEVSYADTPKGPGLTLQGANNAETTLTQLPGLPSPKEVGNNVQVQNLGALQSALMAQTDFQAEIGRQPAIRKAFGDEPVDLNDTKKRQKVWQIMYGVFKQSGSGALGALMALIGRYLKAFTIHTMYNVRDWGKSYLDSEMPTDLAGRAEKDCGVYALTVAWDVYQTVKRGDAKLEVTFELTTMLEHVTLVITDKSTGEFYVVNNDQVSAPQTGDPLAQVAPQYGAVRGLPYTVGPAVTIGLGSTKDSSKKFHDDAWTRYLAAVDWGLGLDIPPDVKKLEKSDPAAYSQKLLAIQQSRYETFYREQEIFDRETRALDPLVTTLARVSADPAQLNPALAPLVDKAFALAALFIRLGPKAGVATPSAKTRAILPKQTQYLFNLEKDHAVHPVVRVALAILHRQALAPRTALSQKEDELLQFCDAVPMFKQQVDAYRAAGATGPF